MKTEFQIKSKIKELKTEGSLTSLICIIILLWVLDIEEGRLIHYSESIRDILINIDEYVDKL